MARIAAVFEMQANSASVRQVYAAGDHLFHQGDTDRGIHKIVSGTVTVYRVTADGHRQIEAFAGPGDYVSLCLCATSPTSAEALSRVETEYVTRAAFWKTRSSVRRFSATLTNPPLMRVGRQPCWPAGVPRNVSRSSCCSWIPISPRARMVTRQSA